MSSATTDYASSPAPLPMSLPTITNTATIAGHQKQRKVIIHCNLNWVNLKTQSCFLIFSHNFQQANKGKKKKKKKQYIIINLIEED
jgi:hypothetical protein